MAGCFNHHSNGAHQKESGLSLLCRSGIVTRVSGIGSFLAFSSYGRGGAGHLLHRSERHRALHPEVGPLQHLLPQGDLLAGGVHPGGRLALMLACGDKQTIT